MDLLVVAPGDLPTERAFELAECHGGEARRIIVLASVIWSGARLSMCCRIAQPPEQPNGSVNTLRSNSSAAIAAVFMRERARLRRGRSLTDSISCRTCARRSRHS